MINEPQINSNEPKRDCMERKNMNYEMLNQVQHDDLER